MSPRAPLRYAFLWVEGWLDRAFGPAWNPMYSLGALGFFFYWIVAVSGIYLFIFFDTGIPEAYLSVEEITYEQWWLGGIMRSLHRYASDAMVLMLGVHVLREFSFDRYRGTRWYSWVTGVPAIWLLLGAGITGYWLVWDRLAQYVAEATTEWLDWLPIFASPAARNFLAPSYLEDRFFTLMVFIHIALPLVLLFVMWFHVNRVSAPKMNPARGLAVGSFLMLLILSLVEPAESQGIADLARTPSPIGLDWFYLWVYPLIDAWDTGPVWVLVFVGTLLLMLLPWLPPRREKGIARVDLDNCNGCTRCAVDCPYGAIAMKPRSDGKPFEHEAVVSPSLCVACGICAGACPTSTPFRRGSALVPGIDLDILPLAEVRDRVERAAAKLSGHPKVMVFGCDNAAHVASLRSESIAAVSLPCTGQLPPSFIDYVLSRNLAEGVVITGCREGECAFRFGPRWTEARLDGTRDPRLRERVPRERILRVWAAATDGRRLHRQIAEFQASLARAGDRTIPSSGTPAPEQATEHAVP